MTPYRIADFGPSDLLTNSIEGLRRAKSSSESSEVSAAIDGKLYSITAFYLVPAGEKLALNVTPSALSILHQAVTNAGFPISVYGVHATGTADGLFTPKNLNLSSSDESPTTSQLFLAAVLSESSLRDGSGSVNPNILFGYQDELCVVVENTTASQLTMSINLTYEEIGPRSSFFGLTASTLIQANTEMSTYG